MEEYKCEKCRKPLEKSYYACDYCIQAARIVELEAACKLENELKTAGSLRELKLMGEVGELRKQLADLRGDRDTLAKVYLAARNIPRTLAEEARERQMPLSAKRLADLIEAVVEAEATDTSGALTRAGKDHP